MEGACRPYRTVEIKKCMRAARQVQLTNSRGAPQSGKIKPLVAGHAGATELADWIRHNQRASPAHVTVSYNYRCTKGDCRKRTTLPKMTEFYLRVPPCKGCGRKHTLSLDPAVRKQTLQRTCKCRGIRWPHRVGTYLNQLEFCDHAKVDLTFEGSRVYVMAPEDVCPF